VYCPITTFYNSSGILYTFLSFDNANWSTPYITSGTALTLNAWNHIAVVRNGSSFKMYLNGTQVGSTFTSSSSFTDKAEVFNIGGYYSVANTDPIVGYMDSFRISKGIARWTANFNTNTLDYGGFTWTAITASSTPNYAYVTADESIYNGSISYYISRDSGTTYTLCAKDTLVNISAQPSGTSMILKVIVTGNAVLNAVAWGWK
jgi:hypothetical protein